MFPKPTHKQIEELENICTYYTSREAMERGERGRKKEIERFKKQYGKK